MSDQRNLILAIVLSVVIILGFQFFYEMPRMREAQQRADAERATATQTAPAEPAPVQPPGVVPGTPAAPVATAGAEPPRLRIDNGRIHGTVSLKGARIDRVTLAQYRETIDPNSPEITLLSPPGSSAPYFAEFGWVGAQDAAPGSMPNADTLWQAEGERLTPDTPVTLRWDNGQGLAFAQELSVDRDYMFAARRTVTNSGTAPVTLYPYGLLEPLGHAVHDGLLHPARGADRRLQPDA